MGRRLGHRRFARSLGSRGGSARRSEPSPDAEAHDDRQASAQVRLRPRVSLIIVTLATVGPCSCYVRAVRSGVFVGVFCGPAKGRDPQSSFGAATVE